MKNTHNLKLYCLAFFSCVCLSPKAQTFDSVLNKLKNQYPQEKAYLHFDKGVYNPGETIWFKAYLFSGNFPSQISKSLYAELLDEKGNLVERKTMPVVISSAASFFEIPKISGSLIYVRAYTSWMLNFDSSFLFTKAIPLINVNGVSKPAPVSLKNNTSTTIQHSSYFLQFMPEGGDLVEQVESRIAFKATSHNGKPVNVSGDILDSRKNKITSFKTQHDGMGEFIFIPNPGQQYKAIWKDPLGILHETLLPPAKSNGVVLEVINFSNQIEFKVKRSAITPVPYPFVYVVAQMHSQILYRARANLSKTSTALGVLPIADLPAGIVQVTVFSPDEKPIDERIVFVNQPKSYFITDLNAAVKDLDKRKKNVIQIDVPDTIHSNLSISVTDAELDPNNSGEDIFSNLLLTSDIKGYIHNPAYYFSSDADSVIAHLDLVMMTNGWRRFNWNDALAGRFPTLNYQPENYLSIEGLLYGVNKTLMADKEVNGILQLKNGNNQFLNTKLRPDGKFSFSDMIFYDTAKFFYQINNDKKSISTRASFDIKNSLLKEPLRIKPDNLLLAPVAIHDKQVITKNIEIYKEQVLLDESTRVRTLKEVVVTTAKKSKEELLDEEYTSGFFSGGDARIFSPDEDPSFLSAQNVLNYLQGRVAGLQISPAGDNATWRGAATTFFVNEMQADINLLNSIPMHDVAMVKVFRPPFFGAFGGGSGGAIAVYLKKGVSANQQVKGLDFVSINGYSSIKEFYSPDYSKQQETVNPDYRKTLYWNPFIITGKNSRRVFLTFYNNDITKKMKVIIEGCNENGILTRVEKILQ